MADRQQEKQNAAAKSVELVEQGMRVGLGSGSTAALMIEMLGKRIAQGLSIEAVATSTRTEQLARSCGIPLKALEDLPRLDLTIDGADEIDDQLDLTKGGGGAMLREKVVAAASERLVIIADSSKRVVNLGAFPLPVEVAQLAWKFVAERITGWGAVIKLRETESGARFITDEGNYILDCSFGQILDPDQTAARLSALPGVTEHGLFVGMAYMALIGRGEDVEMLERSTKS